MISDKQVKNSPTSPQNTGISENCYLAPTPQERCMPSHLQSSEEI